MGGKGVSESAFSTIRNEMSTKYELQLSEMKIQMSNLEKQHTNDMNTFKLQTQSSNSSTTTTITNEITTTYEGKMAAMRKDYEAKLGVLRKKLDVSMTKKSTESTNTKEETVKTVTIEITKKFDTVIYTMKQDYEKKI